MRGPAHRTVQRVRRLRRNATDAERKLWFSLRDRRLSGFKFVRQQPIGPYLIDFACREKKLIVEVDGGQRSQNPHDLRRDAYLAAHGYQVMRFWNTDMLANPSGVLETILTTLHKNKS
jgi:very-short-patch-repair endonuclease